MLRFYTASPNLSPRRTRRKIRSNILTAEVPRHQVTLEPDATCRFNPACSNGRNVAVQHADRQIRAKVTFTLVVDH